MRGRNLKSIAMNPADLPFDSEAMLLGLRGWVECEARPGMRAL